MLMNFVEDARGKAEAVGRHVGYASHYWAQLSDKKQVKGERIFFSSQLRGYHLRWQENIGTWRVRQLVILDLQEGS